jgi:two-component system chemotaxis response regulator CheY
MSSTLHFLVVDDQPITRLILIAQLNALGYTHISEAEDGQQALNVLQAEKRSDTAVNFVITDWNMPVMDGLALAQAIRASNALRHLPVLMITADTNANSAGTAMQAGADGYLDKQFLYADSLKKQIDRVLLKRGFVVS